MFQYALGRALSLELSVPLRLDVRGFAGYALHNGYELDRVFDTEILLAGEADLRAVLGLRAVEPLRRLLLRRGMAAFRGQRLVVEPNLAYWHQIRAVPDNCYLLGNWQSEKYFRHVAATIRADFSFKRPLSGLNVALAERASNCTAVSLHVRRGDIATNAQSLAIHGLCSLEYYRKAIEHVGGHVEQPEFFVFSDDVAWARENLRIEYPCHFIDHNTGRESYNDMHLMSLCRHHIIANSSFSWWGAWLDPRDDKIVVAPSRWFAAELDSSDIVPSTWVRI